MGEGANGAARQVDVCNPSSQCVIFIPFAGNDLKVVDKRSNLAFADIKANTGPFAKLLDQIKEGDHALH